MTRPANAGILRCGRKGTLLDEIGEMSTPLQSKTAPRPSNSGRYATWGGRRIYRSMCAVIAATNQDIRALVPEGSSRSDLFYRLNVVPYTSSPCGTAPGTIPSLLEHYRLTLQTGRDFPANCTGQRGCLGGALPLFLAET